MRETIKKLNDELVHHDQEAEKRRKAIRALQDVCEHEWVDDGHDSHNNYKRCTKCGFRTQGRA